MLHMKHLLHTCREWIANLSLVTKLAVTITLALIISVTLQGLLISDNLSTLLQRQIDEMGSSMTRQVANQLKEPILARDELTNEHIISTLLDDENIHGISVTSGNDFIQLSRGINPELQEMMRRLSGNTTTYTWQDEARGAFVTFYAPAVSNGIEVGKVYVTFSTALLTRAQETRKVIILMSTLLVTMIGLLVTYHISTIITRPIYKLIHASRAIASGDYHSQFGPQRGDELGMLSKALNTMTEALIHKGFVEQTLSRYLSDKVAKQVLSDGVAQGLGGRNLEASVLFADMTSFTALSERMDAAATNQLLNDYFSYIDIAAQVAHGHVDKYMGDCAMILFGVPEEDDDHRCNAIYAALLINRLVERVNQQRQQQGKPIAQFSIGINSGNMLAGNIGSPSRMEYTVIGDAVNLASRLCSTATANEILIAAPVIEHGELSAHIRYEDYGLVKVKGKNDPVAVCRVLGLSETLARRLEQDSNAILRKSRP